MGDIVTNVDVKFNSDRLLMDKALGYFQKSDNNKNNNNVRSARGPFTRPRTEHFCGTADRQPAELGLWHGAKKKITKKKEEKETRNKKLSYCWETARRESLPKIA